MNRDQIDVIEHAVDEAVEMPDIPVKRGQQGPLVKDFTGHITAKPISS